MVSPLNGISMRGRRGDDILFKMFEVLHISVDHVQPMLENISISSLKGLNDADLNF
jgi:hypothetical protein